MAPAARTSIPAIDDHLGGLPAPGLIHVYGPPGAGKTTLTMAVARAAERAAVVLTEQPHPHRLTQLLGSAADRVLIARPGDFEEQSRMVAGAARLLRAGEVDVACLDSLSFLYRFEKLSEMAALRQLYRQLHQLQAATRASGGVALFTNQVRGGPSGWRPLGGPGIEHISDMIVSMTVQDGSWRRLHVEKHPFMASGEALDLRLTDDGFE